MFPRTVALKHLIREITGKVDLKLPLKKMTRIWKLKKKPKKLKYKKGDFILTSYVSTSTSRINNKGLTTYCCLLSDEYEELAKTSR